MKIKTHPNVSPNISALTTLPRDQWATLYENLETANKGNLDIVKNALFSVTLNDLHNDNNQCALDLLCGNNIWYDKALSFIVGSNGKAGLNGEHTPCEAVISGKLVEYCVDNENDSNVEGPECEFNCLEWKLNKNILDSIKTAEDLIIKRKNDLKMSILHVEFGTESIKKMKLSPDALLQICLQATYYALHSKYAVTYETASTRKFHHGRTECARPLIPEAKKYIESTDRSLSERYELLKRFSDAHIKNLMLCSNGEGIDRHLLGLKTMLKPGEDCDFFKDPSFLDMFTFRLSTSNMSPADQYIALGFAPACEDGYGVNYAISKNIIKVTCSAYKLSAVEFTDTLKKVLVQTKYSIDQLQSNKL